jgi:rRNA maturation endonuclease Nob1
MGQGGGAAEHSPQNTLRCTECGTMNSPTEWYCERCGGELAAL